MEDESGNRLEGLALAAIFLAVSAGLLLFLGEATRAGSRTADWWTRPALAPGVALAVLVVCNLLVLGRLALDLRRVPLTAAERAEGRAAILGWLRPVEFLVYFVAYLYAIQHLGYVPATLVFVLGLLIRVGLRSPLWLLAGLAVVVALTLIFRVGLGVWMPAPDLYDLAPEGLRLILIRYF